MERKVLVAGVLLCFMFGFLSFIFISTTSAQSDEQFIVTAYGQNIWVLNKATRKLIFYQIEKKGDVWKSEQVAVPAEVNLDQCLFQAAGRRGGEVILLDRSTGIMTMYEVKNNHSVKKYQDVNVRNDLK
jgi:hypothetical protein